MIYAMYTGCGVQVYSVETSEQLAKAIEASKPYKFERVF